MTLAEFQSIAKGFARFHGGQEDITAPSDEDFIRDLAWAKANGQA